MREEFTPGPWITEDRAEQGVDIRAVVPGWMNEPARIAHIAPFPAFCQSNANLIASAPDLYAALEQIDSLLDGGLPITHQIKSIARAALLKARGTET